jgi:activator of 2-hydroxyglutaryl-CoA dehydratase
MQVYIGIDWSEKKQDVVLMNDQGAVISQMVIEHTQAGFSKLDQAGDQLRVKLSEVLVGLETAHNLLIDYLWGQGYRRV